MKLSQAIAQLNQLIDEIGDIDLEIDCSDENGGSYYAIPEFWFDGQETVIVKEAWIENEPATPETMVYVEEAGGYYPLSAILDEQENQGLEAVIQCDTKDDGRICYYIIQSPALGITSKSSNLIANQQNDPIWENIRKSAYSYPQTPKQRVRVVLDNNVPGSFEEVIVKSLIPIEE